MSHGCEGHDGHLHALKIKKRQNGENPKSGNRLKKNVQNVQKSGNATFSVKTVSVRPPGFTLSESLIVGSSS